MEDLKHHWKRETNGYNSCLQICVWYSLPRSAQFFIRKECAQLWATYFFIKLKKESDFLYKDTVPWKLLKKLSFWFCILSKRHVIMESWRIVAQRYCYVNRVSCLKAAGYEIIFLDETWCNSCDVKKGWNDESCSSSLKAPVSCGQQTTVLHAGFVMAGFLIIYMSLKKHWWL